MTDRDRLRDYYAQFDEWKRKDTPWGRIEFERALQLIDHHVEKGAHILDLGGGAGRYAIELARRGYEVTLADLSPDLLRQAEELVAEEGDEVELVSIDEVDATDLSRYAAHSFDAVIAFGPFYHLTKRGERAEAAREIARVTRPGGAILAAFIPWQSGVSALIWRAANAPEQVRASTFEQAYHTGVFRNAGDEGFQEGYYAQPGEIRQLFESVGVETSRLVSLRGLADAYASLVPKLDDELKEVVVGAVADSASDPCVVASCGHAVYVGSCSSSPGAELADDVELRPMGDEDRDYELMSQWLNDGRVLAYYGGEDHRMDPTAARRKYRPRIDCLDFSLPNRKGGMWKQESLEGPVDEGLMKRLWILSVFLGNSDLSGAPGSVDQSHRKVGSGGDAQDRLVRMVLCNAKENLVKCAKVVGIQG